MQAGSELVSPLTKEQLAESLQLSVVRGMG